MKAKELQTQFVSDEQQFVDRYSSERPGSAIAKALRILEALVEAERPIALHELSEEVKLPKPSAHRMLLQLEENGLIKRDLSGKRFVIGDHFAELTLRTLGVMTRTGNVRNIMEGLVQTVGETCNLGVLDGRKVLYLERVECDQRLRVHLRAGSRVPLHATALGKLILANVPTEKYQNLIDGPLPKFTDNTLNRKQLLSQLPNIKVNGYSINQEESAIGLFGIAVPVFDDKGDFLAGLAIHAPISRFDEAAALKAVPLLNEAAQKISKTLV